MKRIIALLMMLCALAGFVACGQENQPETSDPTTQKQEETTQPTSETEAVLVEAKRISTLTWIYDELGDINENHYRYSEDQRKLSCYSGDTLVWERGFYPDGVRVMTESFYDEDGNMVGSSEYDENGELLSETLFDYTTEENYRRDMIYDEKNQLTGVTITDSTDEHFLVESMVYDEDGQMVEHINRTDEWEVLYSGESREPEVVRETWTYDASGLLLEYRQYTNDTQTGESIWVYDENGNVLESHEWERYGDYESRSDTLNTYNDEGQLVESVCKGDDPANAWSYRSELTYDKDGNLIKEVRTHEDGDVITDTWTYDENGNLLSSVTHYNMDGWVACETENRYDSQGNLLEEIYREVYNGGQLTGYRNTYVYDEEGRLLEEIYQSEDEESERTTYEFDADGHCIKMEQYTGEERNYLFTWLYGEKGKLLDAGTAEVESLAALGDEVVVLTSEGGGVAYGVVTYETVQVTQAQAHEIESINEHILSSL